MTDKEKAQMAEMESIENKSLGSVAPKSNVPNEEASEGLSRIGWHDVNREEIPFSGQFYPAHWKFQVRAALSSEIRSFSALDSNNPIAIGDGINGVLQYCVRILDGNKKLSWKNICEHDRFFFFMIVRHYTFVKPETVILFEDKCPECSTANDVSLDYFHLQYNPLSDTAKKYFDPAIAAYTVSTKSFGELQFYPINLWAAEAFKSYTIELGKRRGKLDANFAKIYWMLLEKREGANAETISAAFDRYMDMSDKELGLYLKLSTELEPTPTQDIKYTCKNDKCGQEVRTAIQFPDGVQNLLFDTNLDSELL